MEEEEEEEGLICLVIYTEIKTGSFSLSYDKFVLSRDLELQPSVRLGTLPWLDGEFTDTNQSWNKIRVVVASSRQRNGE